ncbi:hypothetical protein POL68_13450 [Stigmatella sp. ncwal1]|uniref:Uncharacterized protein n=1 Tax=Stigmatella ashevillensis TaxID=2995309 RepID=A0ABT5DAZ6_9BACT|nr:hypothetical protein [Stigmatella ashevillena]MDC0709471.1 hypothetical protein [Stigmatella ashevillena]
MESALCAGLSVTSLSATDVSSYGGDLAGMGLWSVSTFSNAVRLEYWVDGTLRAYDERPGNSGTWYHSNNGMGCGNHTFEVRAYPMVIDSNNNKTVCTSGLRTATRSVPQSCPSAAVSCQRSSSNWITCTGGGSGGAGSPTPSWRQYGTASDGTWVDTGWSSGGEWSANFFCVETYVFSPADIFSIEFSVIDMSGMASLPSSSQSFVCEPGVWF